MRTLLGVLIALTALFTISGCAETRGVRYVYQDGDFGVVGLPENTDRWPTHYRRKADKLMDAHFPAGHEIVRAEEVVEGSRTLTLQGTKTAELVPELPNGLFQIGKLGRRASRSQADTLKIKECRIVYHRTPNAVSPVTYTVAATLTPTSYVDPNVLERRKLSAETPEMEEPADSTALGKKKESSETASASGKTEAQKEPGTVSNASRLPKGRASN
jgi:hypothetical protein